MLFKNTSFLLNPLSYLGLVLISQLTACSTVVVEPATNTHTAQTTSGNKPKEPNLNTSSHLPVDLLPTGMTLLSSFSHDFNQDGMLDWVVVAKQDVGNGYFIRHPFVHISQANGSYKQLVNSPFETAWPETRRAGFTVKRVNSNDLLIISGPATPAELPPSTGPNEISLRQSYLFHFKQNDFVLQQYTYGSSFIYEKAATHDSYIFDIPKRLYKGNSVSNARCDFTPDAPCTSKFSWHKTVKNYPSLSLSSFKRFDQETIRELRKYTDQ